MSHSDLAEMSVMPWRRYIDVEVYDSHEEDVNGMYEETESSTSSESEVDSDFDDCDESARTPRCPRAVEKLLRDVGSLLDGNDIGSALFGETALAFMGVPIIPHCVAFMIPDQQIDQAVQVLREAQYPDCKDLDLFAANPINFLSQIRCHALTGGATRDRPIPDHHFHTDGRFPKDPDDSRNQTRGVFLYRASKILGPGIPMPSAQPPLPENPYYMVTSDARLYCPLFLDRVMLNCWGPQSTKAYPVKMLHPARYAENLVYLMVRDIGYSVCNGWKSEFDCMLTYTRLLSAPIQALGVIDVRLEDLPNGPIADWIGLYSEGERNRSAILVQFAALHRQGKKSGQLGEPLMTPREEDIVTPEDIEDCLKNMEEGKPPSLIRPFEESGWSCQLM
ncbi:hypothetical protein BO86DRAFT_395284 [Aspergillus japonicus CBS 114.51]|uniref:Uncharacterized protein n=2 Tax=Aspergillus TaxID=5052 RepID=A0A2V5GY23_ASPV1|nr:hypothetical protein BO86DRAFT_395284 [Aspergillus japonicus CBS 114.51]PYI16011.1 hypothetical protein BO99DRAFT_445737 [Aspergillus violaceofuscus CBS 115571]RAH86662.1 hypothetical protein BO86DRAFT_395284 [Aspergillus japonicus CBS 114.51]